MHETTRPTEIERAALTMLAQSRTEHPALKPWLVAIVNNLGEGRTLDAFTRDGAPLDPAYAAHGYATERIASRIIEGDAIPDDYLMHGTPDRQSQHWQAGMDRAAWSLAHAVVLYRRDGRPDGDTQRDIMGLGAPVATLYTSLAAAVAEYAQHVQHAYATLVDQLKHPQRYG